MITYPCGAVARVGYCLTLAHGAHSGIVTGILATPNEYQSWGLDEPCLILYTTFAGGTVLHPASLLDEDQWDEISFETRGSDLMTPTELVEHPEGGRFQEVFRSSKVVVSPSGNKRSAITHIYFSLDSGEVSRFHKVASDEVWNLYRGEGLFLYLWDGISTSVETVVLSGEGNSFCHVVPAGYWQAAEPISNTVLVGCSVAPGFEFDDFQLIENPSADADKILEMDPKLEKFL